jgi:hypothetical protein
MVGLKKFTLRIDPSSVHIFRFILEAYDNMFVLSTVDSNIGLVEVHVAKGAIKDFFIIVGSLKNTIGLDHIYSRSNFWIKE